MEPFDFLCNLEANILVGANNSLVWYGMVKQKRSTLCIPFPVFVVYFLWSIDFCGPSVQSPVEKCSKYLHCLHYKPETVNFPHDVAFPAALEFHIATCTKQFFQVALKFVFLETTTDWILWFLMGIIRISCFYKNLSDTELILFQTKSDLHCEEKSLLFCELCHKLSASQCIFH